MSPMRGVGLKTAPIIFLKCNKKIIWLSYKIKRLDFIGSSGICYFKWILLQMVNVKYDLWMNNGYYYFVWHYLFDVRIMQEHSMTNNH